MHDRDASILIDDLNGTHRIGAKIAKSGNSSYNAIYISFQMEAEQQKFTIPQRVESWKLLFKASWDLKQNLSPIVTTAFTYLSKFYQSITEACPYDLFMMCLASMFASIKSETEGGNIKTVANAFLVISRTFTQEQKDIFGNSYLKVLNIDEKDLHYNEFISKITSAEFILLAYIKYDFVIEQPFSSLKDWLSRIGGKVEHDLMSLFERVAIESFCMIFVCGTFEPSEYPNIAGAALTKALQAMPLAGISSNSNWITEFNCIFDAEKAADLIKYIDMFDLKIPSRDQ